MVAACLTVTSVVGVISSGCRATSQEQAAYKSFHAVAKTASVAVDTWLRYYILELNQTQRQPPSPERDARLLALNQRDAHIAKLYGQFQGSYNAALSVAQLNLTNVAPSNIVQICTDLSGAVARFTVAK